ncbi:MAG: transcriptional regulator [Tannerella sp.]|jgi:N6-adenosine-specific RNA methylase IME4|nr:transcriptional regulator [Tannerella sp.]
MQQIDLFGNITKIDTPKNIISGYRIYDAEQKRRTVRNDLPLLYPDLPDKKYDIIYADPPWDYGGKMQFDKSGTKDINVNWQKDIFISAANFKYPTLKINELKKIPLLEIAKEDCLLFMWVTNPHLALSIELGQAWGFEYRTVAFVWDKMNHNPGQYTMSYCELCLVFKKGKIPKPRGSRNEKQLIRVPRGEHSEKPLEVLKSIERMFPTQDKIELFARHKPENWDVWGLDVREEFEEKTQENRMKNTFMPLR